MRRTAEGDPLEFEVIVRAGRGHTLHRVTMAKDTCERLTAGGMRRRGASRRPSKFLLDREPKESVFRCFDVTVIARYFPQNSSRNCRTILRGPDAPRGASAGTT